VRLVSIVPSVVGNAVSAEAAPDDAAPAPDVVSAHAGTARSDAHVPSVRSVVVILCFIKNSPSRPGEIRPFCAGGRGPFPGGASVC